jgi:hypothetical protein
MISKIQGHAYEAEGECWIQVGPRMGERAFAYYDSFIQKEGKNETSIRRKRCFGLYAYIRKRLGCGFPQQAPGDHRSLRSRRLLRPYVPNHGGQGRAHPEQSAGGGSEQSLSGNRGRFQVRPGREKLWIHALYHFHFQHDGGPPSPKPSEY